MSFSMEIYVVMVTIFTTLKKLRLEKQKLCKFYQITLNLSFIIPLANGGIMFLVFRCVCPAVMSLDAFCARNPSLGFYHREMKSIPFEITY